MSDTSHRSRAPRGSLVYLPKLDPAPATVLDYLVARFPHIDRDAWLRRIEEGNITWRDGSPISTTTPYRHGGTIRYFREVEREPAIPFQEAIVYQDEQILIADKPHFLPVVPSGPFVNECLVARLQRRTGHAELSPIHRLDLETAGLVLFTLHRGTRARYHELFASARIEKEYHAVARIPPGLIEKSWLVENRLAAGEPWFRMHVVDGEPNAITEITLLDRTSDHGLFLLRPRTGKKHQLRVHLAHIGCPIIGDQLYPDVRSEDGLDYARPLQLLARRLAFRDPVTGMDIDVASERALEWPLQFEH